MTDVVRRMIELAYRLESFPIPDALRDESNGMRLFGYAYLYARPDARFLPELVASITKWENKPFEQYWGLQSAARVMSRVEHVSEDIKSKLQRFAVRRPRGTDRDYELKKLLQLAGVLGQCTLSVPSEKHVGPYATMTLASVPGRASSQLRSKKVGQICVQLQNLGPV